jgi:hypothetical protein
MFRVHRRFGFRLAGFILLATFGAAQTYPSTGNLPVSPSAVSERRDSPTTPVKTAPETHAFWDRTNILLFSGVAVTRGMDYASTRNFMARGRQEILLSDEVVNNSAGFAALEAAGTMTAVGVCYILHRTHHHKLERWFAVGNIAVTGFGDVRNYSLESRHTTPAAPSVAYEARRQRP